MEALQVKFNGIEISKYFTVTDLEVSITTNRTDTTVGMQSRTGLFFNGSAIADRTITMAIEIPKNGLDGIPALRDALNVSQPEQLWFGDEPDRYYMAIPEALIVPADSKDATAVVTTTITFDCYDPYQYALTNKSFTADSTGLITLTNNGNRPTPVSFSINSLSDNGFIGLASADSAIQVGNPDEADGEDYDESVTLVNDSFSTLPTDWDLNNASFKPHYLPTVAVQGTYAVHKATNGDYSLYVNSESSGTTSGDQWYGPTFYHVFPQNDSGTNQVDNFRLNTLNEFKTTSSNAVGVYEVDIVDDSNNRIAGFIFRKYKHGTKNVELFFYVGDTVVNSWTGTTSGRMKNFLGNVIIEKVGNDFTFSVNNPDVSSGVYHYSDTTAGALKATGVLVWQAGAGGGINMTSNLYWLYAISTVSGWKNTKNLFSNGDLIEIDCTDSAVRSYQNQVPILDLQDRGSAPILAPVGTSQVQAEWSSFATTPTINATIQERWI